MKRGKYSKFVARKPIALLLALAMVMGVAIGGTIAWLTDDTDPVVNTFTTSDIEITLEETGMDDARKNSYQMIPGHVIEKDPKVTVDATSEDCYLYVKLEKSANFDTYMTYQMADGWTPLEGVAGVFYRTVNKTDTVKSFDVILDNEVTVLPSVNKELMAAAKTNQPTLKITAYATQKVNTNEQGVDIWTAAQAWAGTFGAPTT